MRKCLDFNRDWYFSLSDRDAAKEISFDHYCWKKVQLPHDWCVEGEFDKNAPAGPLGGYLNTGVGWYRKAFILEESDLDGKVIIEFDGVFMNSEVWINGHSVGVRPYGYISFYYDITKFLNKGVNIIAIRVDCLKQPQSRWYNGCGIYRNVRLNIMNKFSIGHWGIFVTTPVVTEKHAEVSWEITLDGEQDRFDDFNMKIEIIDSSGQVIVEKYEKYTSVSYKQTLKGSTELINPSLWSPESPKLYMLKVTMPANNSVIDCCSQEFGIRKAEFIPRKGFFLNGKEYKFKGVCLHHDGGVVGAAVPRTVLRKRLTMLKNMGCNAIRTTSNPFSPDFYELCDHMGFFVIDELFDGWEKPKAQYDYGLYFDRWHEKDACDFIMRDRNHPCVILWSIGNEVPNMDMEITKKLIGIFRSLDPTRLITCGIQGTGAASDENRALLDVAGYNDGGGACFIYQRDHEKRPEQLMVATEAPHTLQTRSFYRTQTWWRDKNQPRIEIPNLTEEEIFFDGNLHYRSSYDNCGVRVCARDSWSIVEKTPYLCGEFRWAGIDYYGESYGWPARQMESGVIDAANFPKDHYYLYQSMWTSPEISPMIHLLPHWTHLELEPGTVIPVWIYTNTEEAELFLNGKSLGKKTKGTQKHLQWDVPYVAGAICAVGYINGVKVCEKGFITSKEPSKIKITADTSKPDFDGISTIQTDCTITDCNGVMTPYGENIIHYRTRGAVTLIGTENGNAVDLTKLTSPSRAAFHGLCSAVLRTANNAGYASVTAAAILGNKIFKDKAYIYIDVSELVLYGEEENDTEYKIFYTTNLSEPNESSIAYSGGFEITSTTVIKAVVYRSGEKIFELSEQFIKGEKEKITDLIHGNKPMNLQRPAGPFSVKMQGFWSDGGFLLEFKPNGEVYRLLNKDDTQKLGFWWYDFPVDHFEAQDYAGTGEIIFLSGERATISMTSQEADEIVIDNKLGGLSTVYGFNKTIIMKKTEAV